VSDSAPQPPADARVRGFCDALADLLGRQLIAELEQERRGQGGADGEGRTAA